MFTDMVGYSALTQKNEALALTLLGEHRRILRDIFARHHGHEVEAVGDGFFVEFASSLDCVRCAVEIQQALFSRNAGVDAGERINVRIGLHVGDVVHMGKHVHGDGVNIAARIEPLAPPGGICLSEDLARQVGNKIDVPLAEVGRTRLKNITMPVNIYRVVLPWGPQTTPTISRLAGNLRSRKTLIGAATAVLIALTILITVITNHSASGREQFLAVLPFKSMDAHEGSDYFSDGITEDVITQLSRIGRFRITSRTSIMPYKNTQKSLRDIAGELRVHYVLEGSVRRAGDSIRIVAQLIDASTDAHIWSETYDQEFTNIFSIQSDVAKKIAATLNTTLSPTETERIESRPTADLEAYDLYLKGRFHWNKRSPADLHKSVVHFQQAIQRDTMYASAFAGLADAFILLGDFTELRPADAYPKAKAMAEKAIRLDPSLAEAHTSLAYAVMHYDWDWTKATREFNRAIELSPKSAQAHCWYALLQTVLGRSDDAMLSIGKAQELDPFSAVVRTDIGLALYFLGKYDVAQEQVRKAIELDPVFATAHMLEAALNEQKHAYENAVVKFSQLSAVSYGHPASVAALAHAYAIAGRRDDAENMLEVLQQTSDDRYVAPYWIAAVYAGLHQPDRAFEWLAKAYTDRDGLLVFLPVDPRFGGLRSDRRFVEILRKMNL